MRGRGVTTKTTRRRSPGRAALAGVLGLLLAGAASSFAQVREDLTALPLEQLLGMQVIGASRYAQKASEAPSAVTIITAEDIRNFGYRTLADVLNSVRGFHTTYDRVYSYVGVRGVAPPGDYNTRLVVLIDGYRVNDNIFDTGYISNEFPLDLDLVERIEIVKGASSSVYGSNGMFGAVNVITRKGESVGGTEIAAEAMSGKGKRGRMTFGRKLDNGLDLMFSATGFGSDGRDWHYPEFSDVNGGIANGTDYERYSKLYAKATFESVTATAYYAYRNKGLLPGQFGTVFGDRTNNSIDENLLLDLTHTAKVRDFALTSRVFYGDYTWRGVQLYPTELDIDMAKGRWWGTEVKAVGTVAQKHTLLVGAEYQKNIEQNQTTFSADPFVSYQDDRRHSSNAGVYLQDEYALRPDVRLTGGVRYDHSSLHSRTNVSPRLALIYSATPTTTAKLLYGRAFRNPNAYESFYSFPDLQVGNPDLGPERIRTTEAIVEHELKPGVKLTGVAFASTIDGLIQQVTDPDTGLLQFRNQRAFDTRGVELEAEQRFVSGHKIRTSYTLQSVDGSAGLSNAPRHLVKLNASGPLWIERLTAGFEVQYTSERRTSTGSVDGFTIANLTVRYRARSQPLELSASMYNLFDRRYSDPVAQDPAVPLRSVVEQDHRVFRLQALYRL
jgi:outer membrane receptor protein involved in Fe transport